jgi:prepilin-type N-terminal cleavage/methylation domain-containing protein
MKARASLKVIDRGPGEKGRMVKAARRLPGFTLIELLVVIAIIAILAGLTLSTLGYVNRKGAESRARAEVAALSAAIESYKIDFGAYPPMDSPTSTALSNVTTSSLYRELTGQGTVNSNKVYFEPTPNITTNLIAGPFIDPWGANYNYRTNTNGNRLINIGFFDFWSTAGTANTNNWIRN